MMHEYLRKKLEELRMDEYKFFRLAHLWRFERDVEMAVTVYKYKLTGVIPSFVVEYLEHIQSHEQ